MNQKTVLIATLGTEPQVITSALDCLLDKEHENIDEVAIIHTNQQNENIKKALDLLDSHIPVFYKDLSINVSFYEIISSTIDPILDITSEREAKDTFKSIFKLIRQYKEEGYKIHFCLAGGRKTMTVFSMVAAQLILDQQDKLWHLYSTHDFQKYFLLEEFLPDKDMHPRVLGKNPQAMLYEIPFIHWNEVSMINLQDSTLEDPYEIINKIEELQLKEKYNKAKRFLYDKHPDYLTKREREVAIALVSIKSPEEIGNDLFITGHTVKSHIQEIYRKAELFWEINQIKRETLISLIGYFVNTNLNEK